MKIIIIYACFKNGRLYIFRSIIIHMRIYFQLTAPVHIQMSSSRVSLQIQSYTYFTYNIVYIYTYTYFSPQYFTTYQRRCYVLTVYKNSDKYVLYEDGNMLWPKHLAVTCIGLHEQVQSVVNKLTCIISFMI
jgi:hypothetical protein